MGNVSNRENDAAFYLVLITLWLIGEFCLFAGSVVMGGAGLVFTAALLLAFDTIESAIKKRGE